jgi:sulfide:quinone oxidoreductase
MSKLLEAMQDIGMTAYFIHTKDFSEIDYVDNKRPKEVKEGKVLFEDGSEESYDLLLYGPPSRPQKAFEREEFLCKSDPRWMATIFPSFRNPTYDDVFVPTDAALPCVGLPPAGVNVHEAAVSVADTIVADVTGVSASYPFPKQVPLIADFGSTGLLIVFEVLGEEGGKAKTRKYVALTSPLLRALKLSYYLGWIGSLKTP